MKTQNQLFAQISKTTLNRLTNVVNETVAMEFTGNKIFSAADLWNIQRRSRTMMSRRRILR